MNVQIQFLSSPSVSASRRTSGASKNRDWPDGNGTIFLCNFGVTWCVGSLGFLGFPGSFFFLTNFFDESFDEFF